MTAALLLVVAGAVAPDCSVVAPPAPAEVTRVEFTLRPFFGLVGNSAGAIADARLEHYFRFPLLVGVELAPLAVAGSGEGAGAVLQARVHAAYANRYLAVGFGVGAALQRFGQSGLSLAPTLRLGSLDGLHFSLEYAYSVARNPYSGERTIGFSNVAGRLDVPLARGLALELDAGFNLQSWVYATLGLRYRLRGDGGAGTWFVTAGLGVAWIADRSPCNYDAAVPCGSSASAFGPVVAFGLERRF